MYDQSQMDPEAMRRMMMAQALMQGQGGGVPQGVPGGMPMAGGIPGGAPMMGGGGGMPAGVPGGAPMMGGPAGIPGGMPMAQPVGGAMMPDKELTAPMGRNRRGGAARLFGGAGGFQNRYE